MAGVDGLDRQQADLDAGDDAERAAAAAERPEEVRVVVRIDAAKLPVGGDDLAVTWFVIRPCLRERNESPPPSV
jgi:hypothetical protein